MDILSELTSDILSESQQHVAAVIGLDNYKKLVREFGGDSIYFPKVDELIKTLRNEQMISEFNGYNFRELGRKYNLSVVMVRNIVSARLSQMKQEPIEGQIKLF